MPLSQTDLGQRVHLARRARGQTLKGLAARAGCSATHLCEIEQGKTSPTIGTLDGIARALGKPLAYFIEEEELPEVSVVRRGSCLPAPDHHLGPGVERLTTGIPGGRIEVMRVRLEPLAEAALVQHGGEEGGLISTGTAEIRVGADARLLHAGDAAFFSATRPHALKNTGDAPAELLWVNLHRNSDRSLIRDA
jgi:transcriptional regulator with XRE-family HTH domain